MEWQATALVLHHRPHDENGMVVDVFSDTQGRVRGFVAGGNSRSMRPVLQTGNLVRAHWRARLSEQLGRFQFEPLRLFAASVMVSPLKLSALRTLGALLYELPERHPYPRLYQLAVLVLEQMVAEPASQSGKDAAVWLALFVRFEVTFLEETGFGLDLSKCAVDGSVNDLTYVSPRSGCAVSANSAGVWRDRLLILPSFIISQSVGAGQDEICQGLALTGYFLEHRFYAAQGRVMPAARRQLCKILDRVPNQHINSL